MRGPRDGVTGLILAAISGSALFMTKDYRLGRAAEMGPGYFPLIIASLLFMVALALIGRGLLASGPALDRIRWRPLLLIAGAALLFSFMLAPLGLIPATVLLVMISALASRQFSVMGHGLLAIGLALFCHFLFVKILSLPLAAFGPVFGG